MAKRKVSIPEQVDERYRAAVARAAVARAAKSARAAALAAGLPDPALHRPKKPRSPFRRKSGQPPTHGGHVLTRVLRTIHLDTIDHRSHVGAALRRVQDGLTTQLGGPDVVTFAESLLIEQAAIKAVIVQAVGDWILRQECPVNDRQALIAVVMQHDVLQRGLAKLLETLGLERRATPVQDIRQQHGLD